MRRLGPSLLAVVLLAGCATADPPRSSASAAESNPAPRRCSPADPDRWAWFCVVGRVLYGAAAFFTPVNEVTLQ
ncbi:MAG TPA: hypothetical protein VFT36_02975 [Methylomirabilota bacterium]|nr:hypothetical protein [Methylomirabilota bacterium]